jgi:hypothetical protein
MKRETGLRRTSLLTGALVAASVAGTVGVAVAAHASDSARTAQTSSTSSTTSDTGTTSPSLTTGTDDGGQAATSGGS